MIIAFIVIQILLDLYFFWFIILANTALQVIRENVPPFSAVDAIDKLKEMLEEEDKNDKQ
jgi:hypothetical protein